MEALEIEYERPPLVSYQTEIIDTPKRFTVVQAATKCGKTTVCCIWIIEQALKGGPGMFYLWLAPIYSQAKIGFDRIRHQIDIPGFFKVNETNLTLELPNGATIVFKSGEKPDNLYGPEYYAVVMEEFTRNRAEAWTAVRSTITATKAPVKFIGNVTGGSRNWGAQLAEKAKAEAHKPESPYAFFKITAYDAAEAGILSLEEIEQAKADLTTDAFKELYLAEVTESGSNVFGFAHIDDCTKLLSDKEAVCYGIDLARGKSAGADHTVIIGLDEDCAVCYFARFQHDWEWQLEKIKLLPKNKRIRVDSTGMGDVVCAMLEPFFPLLDPFVFTQKTKMQIIEGLAVAIQQNTISFPEGLIPEELKSLETTYTRTGVSYEAAYGHDDCVMALALALSGWSSDRFSGYGNYCFLSVDDGWF